jgi:HD-GYP domain-containing protein (c-di-GMP phosphodiesterase class II)
VHAADAYVAMMRDRPYRKAMQQEEAFAELVRHSDAQFDRDVVEALIATELARPSATLEAIRNESPSAGDGRPLAA